MNNCSHFYSSPYNILPPFPTSIGDNFCLNFSITVESSKYNCFTICTSAAFAFDSFSSKIAAINFDFSFQGGFQFTELGHASVQCCEIAVDCVAVEMRKLTDLDRIQIQGKQLNQLSEFLLRNSGTLNILVSHLL